MRRVDSLEVAALDVRVDLGGRDVGVAQHGLDGPQIGAASEEVRRERVAQLVGGDAPRYAGSARVPAEELPEALPGHAGAPRCDEQVPRGTPLQPPLPG